MPDDIDEQLRAIDPAALADIVRQDLHLPAFQIIDWSVDRLSGKGIANPDGLFLVSGHGKTAPEQLARAWSVVLKLLQRPEHEQDQRDIWYWKRELLAAQSGLLERLPGPVAAPRIYAAVEHEDSGWLWMEHVSASASQPWTMEQYALAARELGQFNGVYLTGTPLPEYSWLYREHCRWWLTTTEGFQPDAAWENRFVQAAFRKQVRPRVEQVWVEKEIFLDVLRRVPQVFSHFDFQRRNLFIRAGDDGQEQVTAIDWAMAGCAAIGGDVFSLIGSSALLFEVEPEAVPELEAVAFESYLGGLRDAGWSGDPDLVRLGYTAWFALWIGAAAPTAVAVWTSDETGAAVQQQFGRGAEAYAAGMATLCEFALERAEQARTLIRAL